MARYFPLETKLEVEKLQKNPEIDQNKLDQILLQAWPALQSKFK